METTKKTKNVPREESPLARWQRMYLAGDITLGWLMWYLNDLSYKQPPEKRTRFLRNSADILRQVRDSANRAPY